MKLARQMTAAALASALLLGGATAASAAKTVRALTWFSNQPQIDDLEIPFWKDLSKATNDEFTATYRTINEVGLKGFESLRTLQSGAFDIVAFQFAYVGGDDPALVGHDLPGLASDFETVRKVADAYRPVLEQRLREKFNGKLLAQWPFPPQILFCKEPIEKLSDLKGRKVRVNGAVISAMVKSWGATAVTLSGPEVYQGMQRGLVECAATGAQYGNQYGWYEVSKQLYVLPIGGYALVGHVARLDFWNGLTENQRKILGEQMGKLEKGMWAMGAETHQDGVNCNTGNGPCKSGKVGKMSIRFPGAEDQAFFLKTFKEVALPTWIESCERDFPGCGARWRETVGKAVNVQ
ncbi:MAG: TRAP transporter substrate-binding protein [Proteobacteria bacterium]|nr:TRAP transporter substrate-binding protein [Pseudomonadota bacterium]